MLIHEDAAVDGAEGAEGVRGEERLCGGVVGHHDFRPVDHGGGHEAEGVAAGLQHLAFLDDLAGQGLQLREELVHEGEGLHAADQGGAGIQLRDGGQRGAVVGLHVQDDDIVERAPGEGGGEILQELVGDGDVRGVEEHGLLIRHEIAVVGDPVGQREEILKAGNAAVAGPDPERIRGHLSVILHVCELLSWREPLGFTILYYTLTGQRYKKKRKLPASVLI